MEDIHCRILELLDELPSLPDEEFVSAYRGFVATLERLFSEEGGWMEDIGFPQSHAHQELQCRILAALHNVHFHIMEGNLKLGRDVVSELLPQWLILHEAAMDSALAFALQIGERAASHYRVSGRRNDRP